MSRHSQMSLRTLHKCPDIRKCPYAHYISVPTFTNVPTHTFHKYCYTHCTISPPLHAESFILPQTATSSAPDLRVELYHQMKAHLSWRNILVRKYFNTFDIHHFLIYAHNNKNYYKLHSNARASLPQSQTALY